MRGRGEGKRRVRVRSRGGGPGQRGAHLEGESGELDGEAIGLCRVICLEQPHLGGRGLGEALGL